MMNFKITETEGEMALDFFLPSKNGPHLMVVGQSIIGEEEYQTRMFFRRDSYSDEVKSICEGLIRKKHEAQEKD